MPDIYSGLNDGWILKSDSSFSGAREATAGTSANSTASSNNFAVRTSLSSGRGGNTYYITRSFFYFDTSSVVYTPVSATLKIYGVANGAADLRVVKSTQGVSLGLAVVVFDSIVGWDHDADNSSNVTYYDLAETTTWSTSGYNEITLNATALQDIAALDTFKCCLIEHDYDLRNDDSGMSAVNYSGLYYANNTGTSKDPYISYTVADNDAVFFGANF